MGHSGVLFHRNLTSKFISRKNYPQHLVSMYIDGMKDSNPEIHGLNPGIHEGFEFMYIGRIHSASKGILRIGRRYSSSSTSRFLLLADDDSSARNNLKSMDKYKFISNPYTT